MWRDAYIAEKLRELQAGNEAHLFHARLAKPEPMVWPIVRAVGRRLRQAGEQLETWAAPDAAETEQREIRFERRANES